MNADVTTYTESMGHSPAISRRSQTAIVVQASRRARTALIARLRRGDEGAFDELVNQHHSALIRMAMGYVADREVAEEVVQDTWMAVIESLNRFEGRSSLRTWICGILIHKAKDRGVREKRHTTFSAFESYDDDNDEAVDPSRFQQTRRMGRPLGLPAAALGRPDAGETAGQPTSRECDAAGDRGLAGDLKEVLILRDVEGVEAKEVCEMLKITETNLYVRLHRARERVRAAVELSGDASVVRRSEADAVRNLGMGRLRGDTSKGGPLHERPSFTMDPQRTDLPRCHGSSLRVSGRPPSHPDQSPGRFASRVLRPLPCLCETDRSRFLCA